MSSSSVEPSFDLHKLATKLMQSQQAGNSLVSIVGLEKGYVAHPQLKGDEIFPFMKNLIQNATSEVLILNYKIDPESDAEKDLIDALTNLSKNAQEKKITIDVKILVNRRAGLASVVKPNLGNFFQRVPIEFPNLKFQYVEHPHKAFGSYHSKLAIVDGQHAMVFSGNIAKSNNYKDGASRQVDIASVFHGPIVRYMRQDFINAWESKHCQSPTGNVKLSIPAKLAEKELNHPPPNTIEVAVLYLAKKAVGNVINRKYESPYNIALIEAIDGAKTSINLLTTNLNHPDIIDALARAHKRNIQINILMGKNSNDSGEKWLGGTNQHGIQLLLDRIVELGSDPAVNLDIRWSTDDVGEAIIPHHHDNMMHAKLVCCDNVIIAGSSICDLQSAYYSRESDVVMISAEVKDIYMSKIFNPQFNKAKKITEDPENTIVIKETPELNYKKNVHLLILKLTLLISKKKQDCMKAEQPGTWENVKSHLPGGRDVNVENKRIELFSDALRKIIANKGNEEEVAKVISKSLQDNAKYTQMLNEGKLLSSDDFGKLHLTMSECYDGSDWLKLTRDKTSSSSSSPNENESPKYKRPSK